MAHIWIYFIFYDESKRNYKTIRLFYRGHRFYFIHNYIYYH